MQMSFDAATQIEEKQKNQIIIFGRIKLGYNPFYK